ncbi:MAG: hypothetical protein JNK12_11320 [Acidimicrobiales bacterium]|nr:hypothetical protein [Acidimicrobiales bacterium]
MDDKQVGPPEIIAIASVAVFFIATFLPWFTVSVGGDSSGILSGQDFPSANGWDAGFLWSGLPLLCGFALLALLLLPKFAPDVTLPDLPPFLPLAIAGFAAFLVLVKLLIGADVEGAGAAEAFGLSIDVSRSFGIFLAFLASLGMVAAGFLAMQAGGKPLGGSSGSTPPQPF